MQKESGFVGQGESRGQDQAGTLRMQRAAQRSPPSTIFPV
jgi:hypothetical protein